MQTGWDGIREGWAGLPLVRIVGLGGLVLLLQIPIWMISGIVEERRTTRDGAVGEVSAAWGFGQAIAGPYLVVPGTERVEQTTERGVVMRDVQRTWTLLPSALEVEADLASERRYRGIFEVPVYRSALHFAGRFQTAELRPAVGPDAVVDWSRAEVVFEISDPRAIEAAEPIRWASGALEFRPGGGLLGTPGIHAALPELADDDTVGFDAGFRVRGSRSLRIAPLGELTRVTITGDWPDPSFQGAWLPAERDVRADGFEARWDVAALGRNYPQAWRDDAWCDSVHASFFGVDLVALVDAYRTTERSLKYQLLFLGLTFVTLWLFEVLAGLRVHPVQYGLIGAALCVFFLLELALGEHLGFALAYGLAASAVAGAVAGYANAVLHSGRRAAGVAGLVGGLYAYLYVLLQIQDFALLVGSIGLFVAVVAIMFATRNVDWYASAQSASDGSA